MIKNRAVPGPVDNHRAVMIVAQRCRFAAQLVSVCVACGYPIEFLYLCGTVFDQMAPLIQVGIVVPLHFAA